MWWVGVKLVIQYYYRTHTCSYKKILNLIRALHRKALSRVNTAVGKVLFAPIPKSCKLPVIFVKKNTCDVVDVI